MSTTNRTRFVAALGVVALVLGGASLAWACSRTPTVSLTPTFGRAGSQTTMTGTAFSTGEPVEIRWNSTGGPLLGRAVGPSFSVAVTIPADASAGVYYIVADAPSSRAQNAFHVRSVTQTLTEPAPTGDGQTSTDANGGDGTATAGGQNSTSASGGTAPAGADADQSGTLGFAEPTSEATRSAQPATQSVSAPAATSAQAPAASASANPAVVTTPAGRPVFGGSAATPAPVPASAVPADEQARVAAGTTSGDLWSGFSSSGRPSMVPSLVDPATSQGPGSELAVGLALLGGGIVALMSGVGVAEMRRKRVLAGSSSR